jgi:hypothetical protein
MLSSTRQDANVFNTCTGFVLHGYQGSEKDREVNGTENSYTTYYRELDSRACRWWAVDPKDEVSQSPYELMNNNPIFYNDIYGDIVDPQGRRAKRLIAREVRNNATFSAYYNSLQASPQVYVFKISRKSDHTIFESFDDANTLNSTYSTSQLLDKNDKDNVHGKSIFKFNPRIKTAQARVFQTVQVFNQKVKARKAYDQNSTVSTKIPQNNFDKWSVEFNIVDNIGTEDISTSSNISSENKVSTQVTIHVFDPNLPPDRGDNIEHSFDFGDATVTAYATAMSISRTVKIFPHGRIEGYQLRTGQTLDIPNVSWNINGLSKKNLNSFFK